MEDAEKAICVVNQTEHLIRTLEKKVAVRAGVL